MERWSLYCAVLILTVALIIVYSRKERVNTTLSFSGTWTLIPTSMVLLPDQTKDIEWQPDKTAPLNNFSVWPASNAPQIVDQGQWGSCTAFSMRYAYLLWLRKRSYSVEEPSTSYWYSKSRRYFGATGKLTDFGSTTQATVQIVSTLGTPSNSSWPYTAPNIFIDPPNSLVIPSPCPGIQSSSTYSTQGTFNGFKKLPNVAAATGKTKWETQAELFISEINSGRCILASINVYSNINTQSLITGEILSPSGSVLGGHAICLIGYVRGSTPEKSKFTFFNSWGIYSGSFPTTGNGTVVNNGIPGLFSIPFNYVANSTFAGDWWSL